MKSICRASAALAGGLLLAGCALLAPILMRSGAEVPASHDEALVNRGLAARLHRVAPSLRIGSADCSRPTVSDTYYRICRLPIDGKEVPIGLRYDDNQERIIPRLLWALVDAKAVETSAAYATNTYYHTPGRVSCGSTRWRVLPPNANFSCTLVASRQTYIIKYLVRPGDPPNPIMNDGIAGLHLDADIVQTRTLVAEYLRAHPHTISGSLVTQYYNRTAGRYYRKRYPRFELKQIECLKRLDLSIENAHCEVPSAFGPVRISVESMQNGRLLFGLRSVPVDLRLTERVGQRLTEVRLLAKGEVASAKVDCGPDRWATLTIPSVRYCSIALSDGREMRLGVEYYDELEGIYLALENVPSNSPSP
jgi:hypothetical protein